MALRNLGIQRDVELLREMVDVTEDHDPRPCSQCGRVTAELDWSSLCESCAHERAVRTAAPLP